MPGPIFTAPYAIDARLSTIIVNDSLGLVVASSPKDKTLMTDGLVPDVNFVQEPHSQEKTHHVWRKTVHSPTQIANGFKDTETHEESESTGLGVLDMEYLRHTDGLASGATDSEHLAIADANLEDARTAAISAARSTGLRFAAGNFFWGEPPSPRIFPQNQSNAAPTMSVPHESVEFEAIGSSSNGRAEFRFSATAGEYPVIVFPGAAMGAKVKATVKVESLYIETVNGIKTSSGGVASGLGDIGVLYLLTKNDRYDVDPFGDSPDWTGMYPQESFLQTTGARIETLKIHAVHSLKLPMTAATGTDATNRAKWTCDSFQKDIEFTVPRSRVIYPFFIFNSADSLFNWASAAIPINDSTRTRRVWLWADCNRVQLTIKQIGT